MTMHNEKENPVLQEYARLASSYDSKWSSYVEATIRETLARIDCNSGDCLLDVGCGTGELLSCLANAIPNARFVGIDPTQEMLEVAGEKLKDSAKLVCGWAEALPFPADSFDVVVTTSVFHYFRDPDEALRQFARVLKPDGRLVLTDWCDDFLACRICDRFLRWFNTAHSRIYGEADCRRFLEQSSFENIKLDTYKISWLWGMMTATARNSDG